MAGVTPTQSLRYGQVTDVVAHTFQADLADDIDTQLQAAITARNAARLRPRATARRVLTSLSVAATTLVVVPFDSEADDTNGMVDVATQPNRITCSASAGAGGYYVSGFVDSAAGSAFTRSDIQINRNGTQVLHRSYWGQVTEMFVDGWVSLAVGDYLELAVYHEGGGTVSMSDLFMEVQKFTN